MHLKSETAILKEEMDKYVRKQRILVKGLLGLPFMPVAVIVSNTMYETLKLRFEESEDGSNMLLGLFVFKSGKLVDNEMIWAETLEDAKRFLKTGGGMNV